ncbi:MAG TPA: hypothetical protein VEJ84_14570 [Acidimicrobiales bacterium]|nr:hypothetical protein [Acidimicrobiales bacterium]
MSEDGLRRLLEKLDTDESFRQQVLDDPEAAIAGMGISGTERYALVANDQDALRRLVGAETSGYSFVGSSGTCTQLFGALADQGGMTGGCSEGCTVTRDFECGSKQVCGPI